MTHLKFLEKIKKGLGSVPIAASRDNLSDLLLNKGTRVYLRYEWIKNNAFWDWLHENEEVGFNEGTEWIEVFTYD